MGAFSPLSELADMVQDRLEEERGPGIFWSRSYEIYPALVEAMREAVLLSGEPEQRAAAGMNLAVNTTIFNNPDGAVALLRLEGPGGLPIRRESVANLDRMVPGWPGHTGKAIKYWFPFGMTKFGIYPKLTAEVQVIPTVITLPISTPRPYDGGELMPFQEEFLHGLESYAAHVLRVKEGGLDFEQSLALYGDFIKTMQDLSKFALRKAPLRFTRRGGVTAQVTEKE